MFDGYSEAFDWTAPSLAAGLHVVEGRSHDSVGNWSAVYAADTIVVDASVGVGSLAGAFRVFAPRPNPIRGPAEIPFVLPEGRTVDAEVLDLAGRRSRCRRALRPGGRLPGPGPRGQRCASPARRRRTLSVSGVRSPRCPRCRAARGS
jgi:hypothetical protein